jgi:hypothetical protein
VRARARACIYIYIYIYIERERERESTGKLKNNKRSATLSTSFPKHSSLEANSGLRKTYLTGLQTVASCDPQLWCCQASGEGRRLQDQGAPPRQCCSSWRLTAEEGVPPTSRRRSRPQVPRACAEGDKALHRRILSHRRRHLCRDVVPRDAARWRRGVFEAGEVPDAAAKVEGIARTAMHHRTAGFRNELEGSVALAGGREVG